MCHGKITHGDIKSSVSATETVLSVILAFCFSGLAGIFFGFYSVYEASFLNPINALRYEPRV